MELKVTDSGYPLHDSSMDSYIAHVYIKLHTKKLYMYMYMYSVAQYWVVEFKYAATFYSLLIQ